MRFYHAKSPNIKLINMKSIIFKGLASAVFTAAASVALVSCNDYLDLEPQSSVAPETYFTTAEQLGNYTIHYYAPYGTWSADGNGGCLPKESSDYQKGSLYHDDIGTDNESGEGAKSVFFHNAGVKVGASGGLWDFGRITAMNFFIRTCLPKLEAGEIAGDQTAAKHYLGEGYFLRALEYFFRMRKLGDFPIVTTELQEDRDQLIAASKRRPRNLVARFIISDLDSALTYLTDGSSIGGRNRITRDAALLVKARVALYEATFEKYFAGTPFVPDAAHGWPGAAKDYNQGFTYDNAAEVDFFLKTALEAAAEVADAHPQLADNTKRMIGETQFANAPVNPYYDMFAGIDASQYDEVLMWHAYSYDKGVTHPFNQYMHSGTDGFTQEFQNAFLMESGLPIYAPGNDYQGDDYIESTKANRDWRWRLFTKAPGEYVYMNSDERFGMQGKGENYVPRVFSTGNFASTTGYAPAKMFTTNSAYTDISTDETNTVIYRAAEAYLIYMEAAWEKYGDGLDAKAWDYWRKLRTRAGVGDPQVTIAATDLDKEWELTRDLGLYSGGNMITSKVLFNIRRERRCEFMSEGFRMDDLIRWRALDQLMDQHLFLHGCKIHGPMADRLKSKKQLKYDQADPSKNNISSPNDVDGAFNGDARYISVFRRSSLSDWYAEGMTWHMAHYLSPIAVNHFLESSVDGSDIQSSPIYQNPYWGTVVDTSAER